MKLNFNVPVLDLAGEKIENQLNLGAVLANALVSQPKGDVLKFFTWALDLFAGKAIDLDKSDQKTLQEFITNCDSLTILAKGQMLQVFERTESKLKAVNE